MRAMAKRRPRHGGMMGVLTSAQVNGISEIVGGGLEILRPVTRETLARRICDAIKAYIVSQNLEPGSQLFI